MITRIARAYRRWTAIFLCMLDRYCIWWVSGLDRGDPR